MSWSKNLVYALGLRSKPDPLSEFPRPDADERIRNTLAQNSAIGGSLEIVDTLMSAGELVGSLHGEKIIEQNAHGDDVFFLLAGEVDIVINGRKRTFRGAPNQVGEMAAIEPGSPRSATVQVRSEAACAWRVPGNIFRKVWSNRADFKGRLQVEMASRHREQLAAVQVANENLSLLWFVLSIGAAVVAGGISWLSLETAKWTLAAHSVATGGVALATFIFVLLQNPAFIWRRSFSLLLWCLVGKTFFDTSVTIEAEHGFGSLQFSLLPSGAAVDIATSLGTSLPILIAMGMCLWKDNLESRK